MRRGASCAIAPSAIAHSNSQLAPPKWNARFFLNVIVPILIPSMVRRIDSDFPSGDRPRGAAIPSEKCVNQSRSGDGRRAGLERGMERAEMRELGTGGRGAEVRPPAAAPAAAVSRTGNCWPARGRRRSRSHDGCWSVSWLAGCCCGFGVRRLARPGSGNGEVRHRPARSEWPARRGDSPWKCPNDSANWIASANSASREPVFTCFRNQFIRVFVPMLYYNIEGKADVNRPASRRDPSTLCDWCNGRVSTRMKRA